MERQGSERTQDMKLNFVCANAKRKKLARANARVEASVAKSDENECKTFLVNAEKNGKREFHRRQILTLGKIYSLRPVSAQP
jgi:hypothetical protein